MIAIRSVKYIVIAEGKFSSLDKSLPQSDNAVPTLVSLLSSIRGISPHNGRLAGGQTKGS